MTRNPYDIVLEILLSGIETLKGSAELSGRDIFPFYREANLDSLDISGQDLTGLDFKGASLRGTNLQGATIDLGALNNSIIDEEFSYLQDDYDISVYDYGSIFSSEIYSYCLFRKEFLDKFMSYIGYSFTQFSDEAGISQSTLRKSRRGQPVMDTTCLAICRTIFDILDKYPSLSELLPNNYLDMSNICIGHFRDGKKWERLSRREYSIILEKALEVNERLSILRGVNYSDWNRSPDLINWQYNYFVIEENGFQDSFI